MKKKDYTVTIIVVVGLFLLTMILLVAVTPIQHQAVRSTAQKVVRVVPTNYTGLADEEIIGQSVLGGQVSLLSLALKEGGYVAIHKEEKGKPGKIIGISPLIQDGLYSNGSVGSVQIMEPISPGDTLFVALHSDYGDGAFFQGRPAVDGQ